jgi:hypothetical protein
VLCRKLTAKLFGTSLKEEDEEEEESSVEQGRNSGMSFAFFIFSFEMS